MMIKVLKKPQKIKLSIVVTGKNHLKPIKTQTAKTLKIHRLQQRT